jgi:hypothetical protein
VHAWRWSASDASAAGSESLDARGEVLRPVRTPVPQQRTPPHLASTSMSAHLQDPPFEGVVQLLSEKARADNDESPDHSLARSAYPTHRG